MADMQDTFPKDLCLLLHQLGISTVYRGFYQTAYAVMLTMEDMERLLSVTKRLYYDVGKRYGTTAQGVERNIHTVAHVAWKRNRPLLEELAHTLLPAPPSPSRFVSILTVHLLMERKSDSP